VRYIDYSYLRGDKIHECQSNVTDTYCLFTRLGYYTLCEISAWTSLDTGFSGVLF